MTPRSDRGAILVHVAISLLGLLAFSAFVLDLGIRHASRAQAQNAADAGAHAAAVSLLYDPTDTPLAVAFAKKAAELNAVWGEANASGNVLVATGLTCPPGSGGGPGCVRVDVVRGAVDRNGLPHTNYLPTFFSQLVGVQQQGTIATATAQVSASNAVSCIRPWVVADKWIEVNEMPVGGWTQYNSFTPGVDTYVAPGFKQGQDIGLELVLKPGSNGSWSAGWTMEIDFPSCPGGANPCYEDNIKGCPAWVPTVRIYDPAENYKCDAKGDTPNPAKGCLGVKTGMSQGPTRSSVTVLTDLDMGAVWDIPTNTVNSPCMTANSCIDNLGRPLPFSARIVPIASFNTAVYAAESGACGGTGCVAQVTNLIGFFVEGMCDVVYPNQATRPGYCGSNAEAKKAVVGRLMNYPGTMLAGGTPASTFARAVRLVR